MVTLFSLKLAAKLEADWASLYIARLMPDPNTIQLAVRYAGRLRRPRLAERLAQIAIGKDVQLQHCRSARDTGRNSVDSEVESESESPPATQHLKKSGAKPVSAKARQFQSGSKLSVPR
ncbi:unnamed protein product [Protopolystoma xenopodis]|uniref:WDHD1/CFT4 helical bundle domain-containing protein n=1 Tax=Protopolystoma xenopodis TaxID=117903 RepID=A0A3S5AEE8_9PLAT|nr:unnamed protein product [Protopolystoma xenopodis]